MWKLSSYNCSKALALPALNEAKRLSLSDGSFIVLLRISGLLWFIFYTFIFRYVTKVQNMKYLKDSLFLLLFTLSLNSLKAQQLPLFTAYREYHSFINPASLSPDYLTQESNFKVSASYRSNLSDIEGAPQSAFLRGEYLLKTKNSFNLVTGGYLLNFNTNPIYNTGLYGKVGALFSKDPYFGTFSVGLTFGALQYRLKAENLSPFHSDDTSIPQSNLSSTILDVGIGTYYSKQFREGLLAGDVVYAGLSVPQILGARAEFQENISFKQSRHYYGTIGFYKYFEELSFIEPSVWIKYTQGIPTHLDFNVRYRYRQDFWFGTGFSTSKIAHFEGGVYLASSKSIKIGYGFDYPLGSYQNVFGTAHEINLSFSTDTRRK